MTKISLIEVWFKGLDRHSSIDILLLKFSNFSKCGLSPLKLSCSILLLVTSGVVPKATYSWHTFCHNFSFVLYGKLTKHNLSYALVGSSKKKHKYFPDNVFIKKTGVMLKIKFHISICSYL